MDTVVSLTKQGQISIPVKLRKRLGWTTESKVTIRQEGDGLIIEKPLDISSLAGTLSDYANLDISVTEARKAEEQAFEQATVQRYKKVLEESR
jgi:AbrB family looped-hinge helix DNA binding protein